ncbi:hypothetical protein JBL43_05915 [Aureibaculum sp. A20]|uniref:T9SS C-terminal target domain-containing protein n=1 Tax=Aureibaculum flavum TaxID=2795986 RepID=A0ABS0WP57_9FLAO|nr:hypothetical protein [Aureibaculum flavum]MBJ2173763.1 hypothetical protein [Aureibaculum flavum]MBJ2173765.1 hypothetical protein [Aureibaculum flavum]
MKNVIKKSLVLVVLCTTMISYANEIVTNENDDVTNVTLNDVTEGSVLSIKDNNGLILYKETIQINGNYSKKFDLTALPDGNYIFELDKEYQIKLIPFDVTKNKVVFDKENESIFFKPSVVNNDGLLTVQKTILDSEFLGLSIFYENGDLVYSEKIENDQIFNKVYDFSSSIAGKYRVVLSNKDMSFEKEIKI